MASKPYPFDPTKPTELSVPQWNCLQQVVTEPGRVFKGAHSRSLQKLSRAGYVTFTVESGKATPQSSIGATLYTAFPTFRGRKLVEESIRGVAPWQQG